MKRAIPVLLALTFLAGAALAQESYITERRQSHDLSKLWLWETEDGQIAVVGQMPPLFEQERTLVAVIPSKANGQKPEKGSWQGTVSDVVQFSDELRGQLPVLVRLNYRKLDRIQSRQPFARIRVTEIPADAQAVLVTCRLGDDEEVRCSQEPSSLRPQITEEDAS